MAEISKSITVSTPVTRQVTSKNDKGAEVSSTVTEVKTQTKTVKVDVPDEKNDKKVDKTEFKNAEKYQKADEQERAALDRVYDKAATDGNVDTDAEFEALALGMAEHQYLEDALATIDKAKIRPGDDTSAQTWERSQKSATRTLQDAETALANVPTDHPQRADAEKKVLDLQLQYTEEYGERAHPTATDLKPGATPAASQDSGKTQAPEPKKVEVKAGDTLSKIAAKNGVTLAELKEANPHLFKDGKDSEGKTRHSGGNLIYPGDEITIPQKPAPESTKPKTEAPKTDEAPKTEETSKTPEADGKPNAQEVAKAKQTIDQAGFMQGPTVDPDGFKAQDQKTLDNVKKALDQIPANDPDRAKYEGKVKDFEEKFNARYPAEAAKPSTPADPNEPKVLLDDDTVHEMMRTMSDGEIDKLPAEKRAEMIESLDRGATTSTEDEMIGKLANSIARTNPEKLTPDLVDKMDDNGVREFMKGAPGELINKLPATTRSAMMDKLITGYTSGEEDQMVGQLAKSLAQTNPAQLTPELLSRMSDDGVRELIKSMDSAQLDKLPAETRGAMMDELIKGYTSSEEDQMIGQLTSSLVRTGPEAITPAVIQRMDDNAVRAMFSSLGAEKLSKLPAETRQEMIKKLDAGYTSGEEDRMIGEIGKSLAQTNPEALTVEMVDAMDDNGVRDMVGKLSDDQLAKMPQNVLRRLYAELDAGWTSGDEQRQMARLAKYM